MTEKSEDHGVSITGSPYSDEYISLVARIKTLESDLATAVEALEDIANHNTLGGDKYNNPNDGYVGVVEFAKEVLAKIDSLKSE